MGVEQQSPRSRAGDEGIESRGVFKLVAELGMERRGVLAVLGVSKMREELGEGHDGVAEVQNTCVRRSGTKLTFKLFYC